MRKIIWAKHGENAFDNILKYIIENSGSINASKVYDEIIGKIELLKSERVTTRKSQELLEIGINDVFEINVKPWKIYYKILNNNKLISIQYILDTRRNIEEVLLNLVIENKI
ncbi:putative plasmid stabilization system protein [Treponema primitia ZAS-2]|uniref:Putative plasmid stabilization system protein n=1 Tax=Treponema primitia (strain ATCC BAA-887 / DSM 12427 / ZAS-2) TaxID=545694 RepID=F5YJ40_TREPZ|nr:type II toxin-antitoxin system RelE/ParE family toxin [Treponema primitia]AEF86892.1 putative plasmid stabilization system protein [Treponema primitia ZAS-2]